MAQSLMPWDKDIRSRVWGGRVCTWHLEVVEERIVNAPCRGRGVRPGLEEDVGCKREKAFAGCGRSRPGASSGHFGQPRPLPGPDAAPLACPTPLHLLSQ